MNYIFVRKKRSAKINVHKNTEKAEVNTKNSIIETMA